VLAELAFWQSIHKIADIPERDSERQLLSGKEVLERLERKCASQLPHRAGGMFHESIMKCLQFAQTTKKMDAYEKQKYFQDSVRRKLEMAVGKI
jgi:hypothetical protein